MAGYGFPRNLRLLKAGDFRYVFDHTKAKAHCPGFLLLAAPGLQDGPRLGFVMGKKHLKRAVQRNGFKRLFREAFRLQQHQLPPVDILVLAVKGAGQVDPQDLRSALALAWKQLQHRFLTAVPPSLPSNPSKRQ